MAKFVYLLVLAAITVVFAEDECKCDEDYTDAEIEEILTTLAKASEEQNEQGLLPGLLSPLTTCGNCIDGARRKRTIFPEQETSLELSDAGEVSISQDSRCPIGYGRIAFRCVPIDGLLK